MSMPEGKDNKNPDNRYLPCCQKYHLVARNTIPAVPELFAMWKVDIF